MAYRIRTRFAISLTESMEGMNLDAMIKLARADFEKDNPGRSWDPQFTERKFNANTNVDHATEDERERYLKHARSALQSAAFRRCR